MYGGQADTDGSFIARVAKRVDRTFGVDLVTNVDAAKRMDRKSHVDGTKSGAGDHTLGGIGTDHVARAAHGAGEKLVEGLPREVETQNQGRSHTEGVVHLPLGVWKTWIVGLAGGGT